MAHPTGPIRTQVDQELQHAPRGEQLAQGVAQRLRERAPIAGTLTAPATTAAPEALTWGDCQQRHPEWRGDYWAECRALYAGGDRLLGDGVLMERLFPRHMHERPDVYEERRKRAHYYPYAGTIIDHLLAGLGTDPLRLSFDEVDEETGEATLHERGEWWERWAKDVTDSAERPADYGLEDADDEDDDEGGTSVHAFAVDVLREALQTRTAWVLADLPPLDLEPEALAAADSALAAEQLGAGLADPYLCLVPAEQVIDWHTDDRGRLAWAIIMQQEQVRETPRARRGLVRHTYTLWEADQWTRYQLDIDPTKPPPAMDLPVPIVAAGSHAFGRVPLERLQLPEGLHAMGKLHSLAREHLNKRCAMSWAEYKSLFAVLYEFMGAEDKNGLPIAAAQTDSGRALNQIRGQGYTQQRGGDDRAEYIGPDVAPFKEARESCNDAMREMHRVMFSMALSANMDKAALARSGESKAQDSAATGVLLDAFGQLVRRFSRRLLVLAALGRGEAPPSCTVEGLEQFDVAGVTQAITEAVELFNGVPILSGTFRTLYLSRLYAKALGGDASPEQLVKIRDEIRETISAEEAMMAGGMMPGAGGNTNGKALPGGKDDGEGEDEDERPARKDPEEPERPPQRAPGYSSKRPRR